MQNTQIQLVMIIRANKDMNEYKKMTRESIYPDTFAYDKANLWFSSGC